MTITQLKEKILAWEIEHGESFVDYFAHDQVSVVSWGFWLIGKGFSEEGNEIISDFLSDLAKGGQGYVEQGIMFDVYPEYDGEDYSDENHEKNMELLATFLLATPFYKELTSEFFEKK